MVIEAGKYPFIEERLVELRQQDRYRFLRSVQSAQDARIVMDGKDVLLFCSNNYLGLANHDALKEAAQKATEEYGVFLLPRICKIVSLIRL